jgi:hypothetical protein
VPSPKTDPNFPDLENPHCDYLDEFAKVRDGIINKTLELDDKKDFNDWLIWIVE